MAEHPLCFIRKVLIFVCVIFMLSHVGGMYENLTFCILVCDILYRTKMIILSIYYFQNKIRRRHIQKCDRNIINKIS